MSFICRMKIIYNHNHRIINKEEKKENSRGREDSQEERELKLVED